MAMVDGDVVRISAGEHTVYFVHFQDPGYFYRNLTSHMNQNPSTRESRADRGTSQADRECILLGKWRQSSRRGRCNPMTQVFPSPQYCVFHPSVETNLRCNRCERPICTRCAVLTPTGYRCKECVRGQQKTFETAQTIDYPLAIVIALILGFLGSLIASVMGFFTLFIAPVAGVVIAEAVRMVVRRRRSKRLFQLAAVAAAVGSLPLLLQKLLLLLLVSSGSGLGGGVGLLLPLVWQGVYTFMITSTVYYRLAGIRMRY